MSAAKRVPAVVRALAAIRYSELVADLLAAVIRIDLHKRRGEPCPTLIQATRTMLEETIKFKKDYGVEIAGLDFSKVVKQVQQACGDTSTPGEKT